MSLTVTSKYNAFVSHNIKVRRLHGWEYILERLDESEARWRLREFVNITRVKVGGCSRMCGEMPLKSPLKLF